MYTQYVTMSVRMHTNECRATKEQKGGDKRRARGKETTACIYIISQNSPWINFLCGPCKHGVPNIVGVPLCADTSLSFFYLLLLAFHVSPGALFDKAYLVSLKRDRQTDINGNISEK